MKPAVMTDLSSKTAAFRILRAEEHRDWRALRMLLPDAIHHGCGCDAFVATDDERSRRLIGAIAMAPLMRTQPRRGPKVALHVTQPWRGRGVEQSLLNVATSLAAARGAEALFAWNKVSPDSEEARAWQGLGFDQKLETSLTRIDAARTIEMLEPLVRWLRERGQIPADAQLVPLGDANPDEVVELVTSFLAGAGAEDEMRNRLTGNHPRPPETRLSRALLCRGRVAGVMIGTPVNEHVGLIEVNVVHPALRGGWANAWLKLEATRAGRDGGYDTFLYETHDQHADTMKLTRRLGGVVVPRVELYRVIATNRR